MPHKIQTVGFRLIRIVRNEAGSLVSDSSGTFFLPGSDHFVLSGSMAHLQKPLNPRRIESADLFPEKQLEIQMRYPESLSLQRGQGSTSRGQDSRRCIHYLFRFLWKVHEVYPTGLCQRGTPTNNVEFGFPLSQPQTGTTQNHTTNSVAPSKTRRPKPGNMWSACLTCVLLEEASGRGG